MTAEEFYDWVHQPGNEDRFFELEEGEVVEMPPPGKLHGFVCANISFLLSVFARGRRKGYVCTNDSGVLVERDPDTVRGVDVTFYEDGKTAETMEQKYSIQPPVVAVEVISPGDRMNRTLRRIAELLNIGVQQVWLVAPQSGNLTIYREGCEPVVLTHDQELDASDILPGFRCRIAEFFDAPSSAGGA